MVKIEIGNFVRRHAKRGLKFAIVGAFGVIINGLVFSTLSDFDIFNISPFGLGSYIHYFENITWAWGIGILAAFVFDYFINTFWTYRDAMKKLEKSDEKRNTRAIF